jgi:hypothetical protein
VDPDKHTLYQGFVAYPSQWVHAPFGDRFGRPKNVIFLSVFICVHPWLKLLFTASFRPGEKIFFGHAFRLPNTFFVNPAKVISNHVGMTSASSRRRFLGAADKGRTYSSAKFNLVFHPSGKIRVNSRNSRQSFCFLFVFIRG